MAHGYSRITSFTPQLDDRPDTEEKLRAFFNLDGLAASTAPIPLT